jgi:hypothetical protein
MDGFSQGWSNIGKIMDDSLGNCIITVTATSVSSRTEAVILFNISKEVAESNVNLSRLVLALDRTVKQYPLLPTFETKLIVITRLSSAGKITGLV